MSARNGSSQALTTGRLNSLTVDGAAGAGQICYKLRDRTLNTVYVFCAVSLFTFISFFLLLQWIWNFTVFDDEKYGRIVTCSDDMNSVACRTGTDSPLLI